SPWRCSSVGTLETLVPGLPSRRPSYAPKKKSLLAFQIGPPSVPPNWLRWKRVRLSRERLFAQELASSLSLRKYSNAAPWKSLDPPRVIMFTAPPSDLPNCASNWLRWMLTSCTESTLGAAISPPQSTAAAG